MEPKIKEEPERAIPFIIYNPDQGFTLTPEAERFLNSISQDHILGIISVVGKYRTGKSFFVNRVLLNKHGIGKGFQVGPTINACTKGLWMWNRTLKSENPEHDNMKILLVDTEGFAGTDENVNHDSRIILFSLLLSSYFIYNNVGNIDENALNGLNLIINLAKEIHVKSGGKPDNDPSLYFPAFLWIIRDFALKLEDKDGNKMTSKDYLEISLQEQRGLSDSVESKNKIRRFFKHFFRDRDCVTMIRPVESEQKLQVLDDLHDNELRPEFASLIKSTRSKIFKRVKPKNLNGKNFTGSMLVELCKAFINMINNGAAPNIEHAWKYIVINESRKAMEDSLENLEHQINNYVLLDKAHDASEVKNMKNQLKRETINRFRRKALGSEDELKEALKKLENDIELKFKTVKEKNLENWKLKYDEFSRDFLMEVDNQLKQDIFQTFFDFKQELEKFKINFEKNAPQGPNRDLYLKDLTERMNNEAAESFIRRAESLKLREMRKSEERMSLYENDLSQKRRMWEEEKSNILERIHIMEREQAALIAGEGVWKEKYQSVKKEKDLLEQEIRAKTDHERELHHLNEKRLVDLKIEAERQIEALRAESLRGTADFEKKIALLEQELLFCKKDQENLREAINQKAIEAQKYKEKNISLSHKLKSYKGKIGETEVLKEQEIASLKSEFEKKLDELKKEQRSLNPQQAEAVEQNKKTRDHSEWIVEKTYLENQSKFLKEQLEENKKIHDALLMALQQNFNMNESDNNNANELVETNKNLSSAMEKIEKRCKDLENKNEKLKKFKKMINSSTFLQCIHCSKLIVKNNFIYHLASCLDSQVTEAHQANQLQFQSFNTGSLDMSSFSSGKRMSIASPTRLLDLTQLKISINQTMFKEGVDNKPYSEYFIYCTLGGFKWMVARKYKDFCELHSNLLSQFPEFDFPESSKAIQNNVSDFYAMFDSKRTTMIEETRRSFQAYLRDLAKFETIRNNRQFTNFLEIEKNISQGEDNFDEYPKFVNSRRKSKGPDSITYSRRSSLWNDEGDSENDFSGLKSLRNRDLSNQSRDHFSFTSNKAQLRKTINSFDFKEEGRNKARSQSRTNEDRIRRTLVGDEPVIKFSFEDLKVDKKVLPVSPGAYLNNWSEIQNNILSISSAKTSARKFRQEELLSEEKLSSLTAEKLKNKRITSAISNDRLKSYLVEHQADEDEVEMQNVSISNNNYNGRQISVGFIKAGESLIDEAHIFKGSMGGGGAIFPSKSISSLLTLQAEDSTLRSALTSSRTTRETPSSARESTSHRNINEELSIQAAKALLKAKLESENNGSKAASNLKEKNLKNIMNIGVSPQRGGTMANEVAKKPEPKKFFEEILSKSMKNIGGQSTGLIKRNSCIKNNTMKTQK